MNVFRTVFFWGMLWLTGPVGRAQAPGCAQTWAGTILGTDGRSGAQQLPGATVYVRELSRGFSADATGRYVMTDVCPGLYTVEYRFIGYKTLVQTIAVGTEPALPPVTLQTDNINLPEVEVTEHRSEAQQILQTQTELTGAALDQTRGQSLGESLKALTGLYSVQTGPSISKPVIHGLHSNRILILNNGVRQEGQQWGNEHAPEIDQFVASRITVVKGPASIRYGSDAIGGVILVEPAALPDRPGLLRGEVNVVGASNGRLGVASGLLEGAFNGRLTGLSWRLQGTLKRSGYLHTPDYFLENTSYRENNFSVDLHYGRRNAGVEVFFSRFYTRLGIFSAGHIGSLTDLYDALSRPQPLRQPAFSYRLGRPYQDVRHDLLKARAYVRSERLGTLTLTVAQQQNNREEYDIVAFGNKRNPELYLQLITHSADLIWEHKPRNGWSGSVGFNGQTQGNIRRFLFLIPNFRNYSGGLFAIERYARGRWVWEAGLRYDYRWLRAFFRNETTGRITSTTHAWQNANGSLGASYQLSSALTLTGNLSTAWRAPNVSELYANGLHQSAVAYERGNAALRPEQAYNGNVAIEYSGRRLTAEIGLYNNLIHNYIYLKPDSVPIVRQRGAFPAYSYDQVRATFRGIDAQFDYRLTNRLTLISKTSLLFAYDHTNRDYVVFVPPNRTDNALRYEWPHWGRLRDLYVRTNVQYVAEQRRAPAVDRRVEGGTIIFRGDFAPPPPAYWLTSAEVGFGWPMGRQTLRVILSATNLTNTRYRDYLNRFRYFADEPGRSINLKLRLPLTLSGPAD